MTNRFDFIPMDQNMHAKSDLLLNENNQPNTSESLNENEEFVEEEDRELSREDLEVCKKIQFLIKMPFFRSLLSFFRV